MNQYELLKQAVMMKMAADAKASLYRRGKDAVTKAWGGGKERYRKAYGRAKDYGNLLAGSAGKKAKGNKADLIKRLESRKAYHQKDSRAGQYAQKKIGSKIRDADVAMKDAYKSTSDARKHLAKRTAQGVGAIGATGLAGYGLHRGAKAAYGRD